MKIWQDGDYLFDGFAHRPYCEDMDGWRNYLASPSEFECVRQAQSTLDLFSELQAARKRIWELEREVKLWKPVGLAACGIKSAPAEEGDNG